VRVTRTAHEALKLEGFSLKPQAQDTANLRSAPLGAQVLLPTSPQRHQVDHGDVKSIIEGGDSNIHHSRANQSIICREFPNVPYKGPLLRRLEGLQEHPKMFANDNPPICHRALAATAPTVRSPLTPLATNM
jgi:hypothetical protein